MDTIPPGELPLLGEFAQEGLLRVDLPSVQFAHDLMGDWARYPILKFAGDDAPAIINTLAHVSRVPRLEVDFSDLTKVRFQRELPLEDLRERSCRDLVGEGITTASGTFGWHALL